MFRYLRSPRDVNRRKARAAARRRRSTSYRPGLESLESRRLFAGDLMCLPEVEPVPGTIMFQQPEAPCGHQQDYPEPGRAPLPVDHDKKLRAPDDEPKAENNQQDDPAVFPPVNPQPADNNLPASPENDQPPVQPQPGARPDDDAGQSQQVNDLQDRDYLIATSPRLNIAVGDLPDGGYKWQHELNEQGYIVTQDDNASKAEILRMISSTGRDGIFAFYGHNSYPEGCSERAFKAGGWSDEYITHDDVMNAIREDDPPAIFIVMGCEYDKAFAQELNKKGVGLVVFAQRVGHVTTFPIQVEAFLVALSQGQTVQKSLQQGSAAVNNKARFKSGLTEIAYLSEDPKIAGKTLLPRTTDRYHHSPGGDYDLRMREWFQGFGLGAEAKRAWIESNREAMDWEAFGREHEVPLPKWADSDPGPEQRR